MGAFLLLTSGITPVQACWKQPVGQQREEDPNGADATNRAGIAAYTKGDYATAIAKFKAAIARGTTFSDAYFNLGIAYMGAGQIQDAINEFTYLITRQPPLTKRKLADAYHQRRKAQMQLNRADDALEDFEQAIRIKPDKTPEILPDRGNAFFRLAKYEKAIDDFTRLIQADPKGNTLYYRSRALAYLAKFDRTKHSFEASAALSDIDSYLKTVGDAKDGYSLRAQSLFNLGRHTEALQAIDTYLTAFPKDKAGLSLRERILEAQKGKP